ncbi:MAG: 16S rRNA (cytidine(1402)-2'-O)-methyltransferase, partial [Deltaproteobacteria bacterium]
DLLEVCGDREVAVMRELTKLHEEVIRGRLKEVKEEIERRGPRGEMTIVLAGKGFGGDEGGAED